MKITKHKVETRSGGRKVGENFYPSKEEAIKREVSYSYLSRKYTGEVVIDLYCECCDKDLKPGDNYLLVDEDERYCEDCYEEHSVTYYSVGGENVGDGDNSEVYDERDREGEEEE